MSSELLTKTVAGVSSDDCTGCAACGAVCPVGAVSLLEDDDGFPRPVVEREVCLLCGKCRSVCGALTYTPISPGGNSYYAAVLKKQSDLVHVSSGGAFWALVQTALSRDGVVYGAVRERDLSVRHIRAESEEEALPMRGSKYQYSGAMEAYSAVENDLKAGRFVLFSGVPCQIEALKLYLRHDYSQLVTCAVVCHGVPSSKAFRLYCAEAGMIEGSPVVDIKCRNKSRGWKRNCYAVRYADGKVKRSESKRHPFHRCYLAGLMNRASCGHCRYATIKRSADITLADYWQYEGPLLSFSGGMGVSLVVCSTSRGENLLREAEGVLRFEPAEEEAAISSCRHLSNSPLENENRRAFLDLLDEAGFAVACERYAHISMRHTVISRLSRVVTSKLRRGSGRIR